MLKTLILASELETRTSFHANDNILSYCIEYFVPRNSIGCKKFTSVQIFTTTSALQSPSMTSTMNTWKMVLKVFLSSKPFLSGPKHEPGKYVYSTKQAIFLDAAENDVTQPWPGHNWAESDESQFQSRNIPYTIRSSHNVRIPKNFYISSEQISDTAGMKSFPDLIN